ncbi:xin actin-binding repeat-containing protein 1 [Pantherophis guttatus]|uniref:Xin actin-binding repeat-containing protein 1 n=1 Tax=Pantherophis guttatus TaxID=94885 RepID=A0A6P9AGR2_PANGU|nr:xin actin-binding repeat-containing protein 1 [Pantherophis guttatus]XP_034257626.1 xin actin-binding repeat-containing protein 1 [Pantherophis guttatus]XP_034257627.1 xin actin-binding repeat-containing protein 1 [Pantherophis guttatus]
MADTQSERTSSADMKKAVEDLPPPPPPPLPHLQDSPAVPVTQDSSSLPLPPPKESFSKFYQQRQVNELKRLYRHMHPELRKNLEEAVSEDLAEMLSPDDPNEPVTATPDAVVPGEVQSMRWIFENWSLDSIGERQAAKKLSEEEAIPSGDVKNRSMRFENQPSHGDGLLTSAKASELQETKGDVRTARWLFETQPLDSLNKMYLDETDMQEVLLKEPVERGDVKGAAQLFETHSLEALGHCNSVEEENILQLKSEIQELKGGIKKTIKLFQTDPICALQDKTGSVHEIKSICREEIQTNSVKTARWLFETQPLDTINKDTSKVQVIRGISLEEAGKGNVSGTKWVFETQPLDAIKELTVSEEDFKASPDLIQGADVGKQCLLFETQPLDSLKGESSSSPPAKEEVIKGDVKSTLWLFETQPMETLRDHFEVGRLKRVELSKDEKGAVKQTKHLFETCPFGSISKTPAEDFTTAPVQEVEKGDVKAFKSLFETLPLDSIRQVSTEEVTKGEEDIPSGQVKSNQLLLETTPLYAIKDCFGHFHQVTSVSRDEEVTSGGVKNYKWMFETKPLDEFDGSIQKVDVIKGITKQEIMAGDVQTAKWLFETQPIDVIHSQVNQAEQKREASQGGDVKTCRWLFETQPIDALCEKDEMKESQEEPVPQADVKSYTWMFETQPLDTLKGQEEQHLQVRKTFCQEELQGVDVKTVRHLFEMEPLSSNIPGNSQKIIRCSSRVEIQSGEVSRVKEFFEAKPLEAAAKSRAVMKESPVDGNIEPGAVPKFTWLFENCPMDTLKSNAEGLQEATLEKNIQGGDVGGKRFIFETFSLGQIHEKENETQIQKVHEETSRKANVNSCIMLFETQPLYAIQDKDGGYHEVTSVKKEEVIKGDVKGARWQFETKPLDEIKKDEEVFVIRAVTQEDFKKGDVQSARWRFETEPLDSITEETRPTLKSVEDVEKGDVQSNKQLFESEKLGQKKYVRMVSVSDVQQGDVRTSTWLFENQPMDSLKGDSEGACSLTTVQREDVHKGAVKRCTWLFETQPMDSLKDTEASTSTESQKGIPQACVKSTTWLFESTPLDKFSSLQCSREIEAKERTPSDTLELLFSHQLIQTNGILIEANNTQGIKMAAYHFSNQETPKVQKEIVVEDNLQMVLLQLLQNSNVEAWGLLVQEEEDGGIKINPIQLLDSDKAEKSKEEMRNNMARSLQELLNQEISVKKGIVMQETDIGSTKVVIYSLRQWVAEQPTFVKGDVKSVIGNLLTSSQEQRTTATIRREDNEKGNVQLYTRCIEKGDLDYLKNLQRESEIESLVSTQAKEEPPKIGQEVVAPTMVQNKEGVMMADAIQGNHDCSEQAFLWKTKEGMSEREVPRANHQSCTPFHSAQCGTPSSLKESIVPPPVTLPFQWVEGSQNSSQRTPGQQIILEDGKERTPMQVADQKMVEVLPSFKAGETNSTTVQSPTQIPGNDLQAAMHSLRKATAEAKTLQQQVQSKLQKTPDNTQLCGNQPRDAMMQSTVPKEGCEASKRQPSSKVSSSRRQEAVEPGVNLSQKSPASLPLKVSDPEGRQGGTEPFVAHQVGQVLPRTDLSIKDGLYTAKPVKSYVNPFLESDYQEHSVPEEREQDVIIRGDVKTAIRALQNAATEQRQVEKEDVVRGNLKATLESLEKSNINVSQGDFKAAMIYRNAGQSHSMGKKKQEVECLSGQAVTVAVAPANSLGVNDFPPPPPPPPLPPASLMRPDVHAASSQPRQAEVRCCSPSTQPCDLKTPLSSPTKAGHQRPSEKPQLPPKPDVITPPRKKPVIPPKPEFLLKEGLPHPAGVNRGQPGKAPSLPSKSPILIEQNKPTSPTMNQACGAEIWGHLECREDSAMCSSPKVTNVEDISVEKKSIKGIIKLPLQEEEKSKARKEDRARVDLIGHSSSLETIKTGLDSSEGGNCHLTKDLQGFQETPQEETRCSLPEKQDSLTPFECQMNLPNLEVQRKPYLSAKCHANVLRKGTVMTHVTSSKSEKTSMESQADRSASALSSDLKAKQVFTGHQIAHSGGSRDPETKNDWDTEKRNLGVVMREKVGKETEEERRKRLSVHKEEIMKGNVKEAMEIFENLRKQEALEEILTQVKEFEEETSKVDVKALRNLFENVADWVVDEKPQQTRQPKVEKPEQLKEFKEDSESVSSVELAFEDLERASAEIVHLKEQTLSRLLDIEDAIKKALYSISSLKSESDIAGLSGLLKESLGSSQSLAVGNNIRKISIISSKAKQEKGAQNPSREGDKVADQHDVPKLSLVVPHVIQPRSSSPSSPSYISIQSAARKNTESPQIVPLVSPQPMEVATEREAFPPNLFSSLPSKPMRSDGYERTLGEGDPEVIQIKKGGSLIKQQQLSSPRHLAQHLNSNGTKEKDPAQEGASDFNSKTSLSALSPSNPRRQKSILELQTSHDGSKLYGATRTVMEQYEEVDEFGNKIITSSTTVTKQSETQTSSTCGMVSCPTRYEVTASPILRRYLNSPANFPSDDGHQETGVVFVTFSNSKPVKK